MALFEAYSRLCKFERESPPVGFLFHFKVLRSKDKRRDIRGFENPKKMEHHASLPRFSFRGLLSFVFSAETILFGLLSLQVLDLAETGNRCGKLRLLLLMSRGMFEWTFISLLHMCLSVSSFRQRETQGHVGKRNVKSVHRVNVLQERQRSTFEAVKP